MPNQLIIASFTGLLITLPAMATEIIVHYGQPVQDCHIPVTGAVTLDPQSGNLLASGSLGSGCPSGNTGGGNPPIITSSLTSNANPATVSQSFTLSWATQNVDYCTTDGSSFTGGAAFSQGQWPTSTGAHICDGSACVQAQVPLTASVAGSGYHFVVQCYKNGNPIQSTSASILDLTVQSSVVTNQCTGVAPPSGFTRQTNGAVKIGPTNRGTINFTDFKTVFGYDPYHPANPLVDWPGAGNVASDLTIDGNKYVALEFTLPPGIDPSSYTTMLHVSGAGANLPFSTSLSTCPGDFRNNIPYCYVNIALKAGLTASVTNSLGVCKVDPGQKYYFNIIFKGSQGEQTCSGSCTARITNQH